MALTQISRSGSQTGSRGDLVAYTGSDVAAGVAWTETVPAGKSWRVFAIRASLVTDATVSNRRVTVTATLASSIIFKSTDESVQAASVTHAYNIAPQQGHAVANLDHYLPLPICDDWVLPAGTVIASVTDNLQAGDNWGVPVFFVEEFSA
jgi:hypothetical protein